jgi:hypothetical protein
MTARPLDVDERPLALYTINVERPRGVIGPFGAPQTGPLG